MFDIRVCQTEREKQDALAVRRAVFIVEQEVPEDLEIDHHDADEAPTVHVVAYDGDEPVAAGRLRPYHIPLVGKVERVAVLKSVRGTGLGRKLMLRLEEVAVEMGYHELKLNAQCHAKAFYEKLGYEQVGDVFEEAGIAHVAMEKCL